MDFDNFRLIRHETSLSLTNRILDECASSDRITAQSHWDYEYLLGHFYQIRPTLENDAIENVNTNYTGASKLGVTLLVT